MNSTHLNEHDANQGAQSSGEFLGMTGNSGWYLLGSGGATVLMVIFLWGILGVSLLLCLFVGILLCLSSLAYVFTLKNGKPEHYDTDFFESLLVEAGVMQFRFGPRTRRPANPFSEGLAAAALDSRRRAAPGRCSANNRSRASRLKPAATEPGGGGEKANNVCAKPEAVVARSDYDSIQEKLADTEEVLEEMMAETEEN